MEEGFLLSIGELAGSWIQCLSLLIFGAEAIDSLTIFVEYECGTIMGDTLDGGDVDNSQCGFSRWKG